MGRRRIRGRDRVNKIKEEPCAFDHPAIAGDRTVQAVLLFT